jgi:hypothetical protein
MIFRRGSPFYKQKFGSTIEPLIILQPACHDQTGRIIAAQGIANTHHTNPAEAAVITFLQLTRL